MNTFSIANQAPIVSFFRRTVQQPGIPSERHRDGAAVAQVNRQSVAGKNNVLRSDSLHVNR